MNYYPGQTKLGPNKTDTGNDSSGAGPVTSCSPTRDPEGLSYFGKTPLHNLKGSLLA